MDICVLFDGSFHGFLNIVHNFYYEKLNPSFIENEMFYQKRLDVEYVNIYTDEEKAIKVINGIYKKQSSNIFDVVYKSFLCEEKENRFIDIFKYIIFGFEVGFKLNNHLDKEFVLNTLSYAKLVSGESLKQSEFCRFIQTTNDVYYCPISPNNNILPFVCDFFVGRFNSMNFIIHDTKRNIAGIYNKKECVFRDTPKNINIKYSNDEIKYQQLWFNFYNSITNELRINRKAQSLFLPKRYRKNMTEFNFEINQYNIDNNLLSNSKTKNTLVNPDKF